MPTPTTRTRIVSFSITIALLATADSLVPSQSAPEVISMIAIAGRLTMPASSPKGGLASACGIWTPIESIRLTK